MPTVSRSCACSAQSFLISPWAMSRASRISASGISLAPASTMRMASSVPATIRSRSDSPSARSASEGLMTKLPSILPMRTAPTGVGTGMSEIISAAEAPFIASTSYGVMWSTDSGMATSCVSRFQPLGKSGRMGRSMSARGQRGLLAGATLALEERAGDLPGRVHPLLHVDGEGEEVDVADVSGGGGAEHHGVPCGDDDRAAGLLGQSTGLERDLRSGDLHRDLGHFRHVFLSCPLRMSGPLLLHSLE